MIPCLLVPTFHEEDPVFNQLKSNITMKNNYIIVWAICMKVYWSSLVHEPMELVHVLCFFVIYHCIMQYYHICPCYVTAGSHLKSWLRFSEVTSDFLQHLANSALKCSEALWLHLRRSICSVLHLIFSFVYQVLSLVLFTFGINPSSDRKSVV